VVNLWLYRVACARYGGPIATIRDDRKMVLVSGSITQPLVKIYTSAGVQQAVFIWDKGRIEAMGWTSEEDLMIVEQTGEVTCNPCTALDMILPRVQVVCSQAMRWRC